MMPWKSEVFHLIYSEIRKKEEATIANTHERKSDHLSEWVELEGGREGKECLTNHPEVFGQNSCKESLGICTLATNLRSRVLYQARNLYMI